MTSDLSFADTRKAGDGTLLQGTFHPLNGRHSAWDRANTRSNNILPFKAIAGSRKSLKDIGGMVATGGLEPPTPAL